MTLLYCDYDRKAAPHVVAWITTCCKRWNWPIEAIRYDKTRRGWHVIVGIRKAIPFPLVIAAQAIFGSDPKRESFNLMRAQELDGLPDYWQKRANVLYVAHHRGVKISHT